MEIEVLAPEAEVGLQFRGGSRVQSAVQADLAEVSFLRRHALRLEQPDLQGIVRSSCLLRVGLHGFPQAVCPNIQRTMISPIQSKAEIPEEPRTTRPRQMLRANFNLFRDGFLVSVMTEKLNLISI